MNSFWDYFLITIIIILCYYTIKALLRGVKHASDYRSYNKAIENSTGLEKIRLIIRRKGLHYSLKLKRNEDDLSFFTAATTVAEAHMYLIDNYYGNLLDTTIAHSDDFDELSEQLSKDETKTLLLASKAFGIAFGLVLFRASMITNKKISQVSIKEYINSCMIDEIYKKEMTKMAQLSIDFCQKEQLGLNSPDGIFSRRLGTIAYDLVSMKNPKKEELHDPLILLTMKHSFAVTLSKIQLSETAIREIEKQGLLE